MDFGMGDVQILKSTQKDFLSGASHLSYDQV